MFKFGKNRVVIGTTDRASAPGTLLLPNGDRATLVDRDVYNRALNAADQKFEEAAKQLKVGRGSKPERAT